MKIRDVMTKDVHLARPGDTLQEVAARMAKGDFGFVPVADGDQLIGAITDRDIVVRALAAGAAVAATLHMDGAAPLCGPVSQHCILCFAAAASLLASVGVIASGVMLMRSPQPAAATVGPRP